jgi:hypothetical protein
MAKGPVRFSDRNGQGCVEPYLVSRLGASNFAGSALTTLLTNRHSVEM